MIDVPDRHVLKNRRLWNAKAQEHVAAGERAWAERTPTWGIWEVAESEVSLKTDD
jgi:hypothetical protein